MRERCDNPNNNMYKYYGARGITYDTSWNDFTVFLQDMGTKPKHYSLDRINVNDNYYKENCRWTTNKVQNRNRRCNFKLEWGGLALHSWEWAAKLGITIGSFYSRYYKLKDSPTEYYKIFAEGKRQRFTNPMPKDIT